MDAVTLTPDDVEIFVPDEDDEALTIMCADITALAHSVAPCLRGEVELQPHTVAAALAIMRGALIRWSEADAGFIQQQSVGSFQQTIDTTARKTGLIWPSEIRLLQDLCREATQARPRQAFSADRLPADAGLVHATTCDVWWKPTSCSCGAILTQRAPLWGTAW